MAHALDLVELAAQKLLVTCGSRHRDLDEIIIFAGGQISFQHLWKSRHGFAETFQNLIIVTLQHDLDDYRLGQA